MNVFAKITLASMKKNRARTLATVAGVMLSAAMLTAVITFGVSLLEYMAAGAALKYGDWHVAFYNVNDAFVQKQRETDGVAGVVHMRDRPTQQWKAAKTPINPIGLLPAWMSGRCRRCHFRCFLAGCRKTARRW